MGCGGSRLNAQGEAAPATFRPLVRRRIEEIRRRRHAGAIRDSSTPSKKELLLDDGKANDGNGNSVHHPRKSASSPEESVASCVTSEGSAKRADSDAEELSTRGKKNTRGKEENVANDADEDDDDEEEGMLGNEASIVFPGSPSFRVYFVDNDADGDDGQKDDGASEKFKSRDDRFDESTTKMEEESAPKKDNKGKRRRKSLKVLPKGGRQSAVKNLLNVRSCYSTPRSSPDHTRLLTGKKTPA